MSTLIERLREVMTSMGWTTPQNLATVAGVSRSAAAQWLGQGTKIIHTIGRQEAAEKLEKETGYCALWIAKGEGPKRVEEEPHASMTWPLKKSALERIQALSSAQRRRVDDALDVILKGLEAERK